MKQKLVIMFSYVLYYYNYSKKLKYNDISPLGGALIVKIIIKSSLFWQKFTILVMKNDFVKTETFPKRSL